MLESAQRGEPFRPIAQQTEALDPEHWVTRRYLPPGIPRLHAL